MILPDPPHCGPISALRHPLVATQENAFNPCFLAVLLGLFSVIYALLAATVLYRIKHNPNLPLIGPLSPKNTGLSFYLRLTVVVAHLLLWLRLAWAISPAERFSDAKIPAFLLLWLTNVSLILPLHVVETFTSPVPSGVLLTYWPVLVVVECMLVFQQMYTRWPLFLMGSAGAYLASAAVLSCLVFGLEYWNWRPASSMKTHLLEAHDFDHERVTRAMARPNIFQRLTFSWMNPLIRNSFVNQTIHYADLPKAPEGFSTEAYAAALGRFWNVPGQEKGRRLLLGSLFRAFGPSALIAFVFEAGDSLLSFVQPQLLRILIVFLAQKIEDPRVPFLKGVLVCLCMFGVTLVQTALNNQYVLKILEVGLGCRSSLTSLIYRKSMGLSASSRTRKSLGDIINLVSIDAPRIQTCAQELNTVVIAPAELFMAIWSLYQLLGKSAFSGLVVMLAFMPVNTFFFRYSKRLKKTQMKLKDDRNRITNEILASMKSIKLYAWEQPMLARLSKARNELELGNARRIRFVNQFGNLIWVTMPFLVSFSTFASFALVEDQPLTSDIVFPALVLLNILARPIQLFPSVLTYIAEASVALERISEFLLLPEMDKNLVQSDADAGAALQVRNVSFLWDKPSIPQHVAEDTHYRAYKYALHDISLSFEQGDFVCVVGRVGAGKSALMSSVLGQLDAVDSSDSSKAANPMTINGTIAYCSQNPWIMNASVRDNVTFGHELDLDFYMQTMEACQLLPDLKALPDGHDTPVGEKGISLSGGQKARISLARAVYSRADIYVLDDVLSAVDSHVGHSIVTSVLTGLLAKKTVILATNSLDVLQHADRICLLERGRVVESARYGQIRLASYPKLGALLAESGRRMETNETDEIGEMKMDEADGSDEMKMDETDEIDEMKMDEMKMNETKNSKEAKNTNLTNNTSIETTKAAEPKPARLAPFTCDPLQSNIKSKSGAGIEVAAKGSIKWKVYFDYIKACSVGGMAAWAALVVVSTVLSFGTNYWLKTWAEKNSQLRSNTQAMHFIAGYAALGFSTSLMNLAKGMVFWVYVSLRGGRSIHDQMAQRLMKAPMSFFERTPVGRILNRFSNDINKVDEALPRSVNIYMGCLVKTMATTVVIAVALPWFVVVMVMLVFIYGYYQKYYICVQRELKRMVSISRSPIFAHIAESLGGVDTIRAYAQERRFVHINNANVDFNMRSLFMLRSINRWLSVRLQFIGSLIVWTSSLLLIYKSTTRAPVSAGMAGFLMSYTLQVTDVFKRMVRMSAEVEANVVSVERCLEYCHLPCEEDQHLRFAPAPAHWPAHGEIRLHHYSARYPKMPEPALRNVSLHVKPGEKIGVVGRTGAGKSSLVLAMFRMIAREAGSICMDGVDIELLALLDLRPRLSIIPQDAHLYQGTLRDNLDPFHEHSDERLWEVLQHSSLWDMVHHLDGGLAAVVSEGGANFSVGQRQLVCLARALLNPSRILMLDEATAAVDFQTDRILQATIRREFGDKTIVTIAHRLDTVMDSDRIVSLDHGEVKEYDTPQALYEKRGIFYTLCQQGQYGEGVAQCDGDGLQ